MASGITRERDAGRTAIGYLLAFACVGATVLIRWPLYPLLHGTLPYLTLFGGVALATWFSRWQPATLAAVAGFVLVNIVLEHTRDVFASSFMSEFLLYMVSCGIIIFSGESLHRARERAQSEAAALQKAKDAELKQHEQFRVTLASIGDAVIVTDQQGGIKSLNAEAERLTGWSNAEAAGRDIVDVFRIMNEETGNPVESPVSKVLEKGVVVGLANHTVLLARDGRSIPISDSAAPIREPGGPLHGVVLVFRDMSEERAAQLAKERLAAIVEFSGDAIITKDTQGIIQTWNASAEAVFGYMAEEIIGKPITTLIPPDKVEEELGILSRIRAGQPSERIETIRVAKDGRHIPVFLSVSPLRNSDGRVIGASKVLHDISDVVAARESLARERELLATTLASIGDAVITTDVNAVITSVNPVACEMTGWRAEEATGNPLETVFRIVNENSREPVENPARRALREGVVMGLANHTILLRRDGSELPIDDSAAPIRDSQGRVLGCVLVFRDITERRRAEQEMAAMDRRKNEFLAILAHELRNPLAPVQNSIQVMRLAQGDATLSERALATLERQVAQMTRLVDDLLDVARISRGKIELRRERVELGLVISHAIESARSAASSRNHVVDVSLPEEPLPVDGDPVRLAQIFSNLLSNAFKYTEPGGRIGIIARRNADHVTVTVKDNGIGIPCELLPGIFEMFAQVDKTLERAQGGLGIGLSLVKELVEMHGGDIEAASEGVGRGAEFTMRFPLANGAGASPVPPPAGPSQHAHRRRILVVDDNRDGAESLATILRLKGHETKLAFDGLAALEIAEQFRPDVVLLDIGMPRMSGYEACRRLREFPWARDALMIALTGWGQEDDRHASRKAGFDHHLVKPVDLATLMKLVEEMPRAPAHSR
jgi:PAS domain S-box-containing protein